MSRNVFISFFLASISTFVDSLKSFISFLLSSILCVALILNASKSFTISFLLFINSFLSVPYVFKSVSLVFPSAILVATTYLVKALNIRPGDINVLISSPLERLLNLVNVDMIFSKALILLIDFSNLIIKSRTSSLLLNGTPLVYSPGNSVAKLS